MNESKRQEVINILAMQESLLQSYRGMFLATHAILLSVAAFTSKGSPFLLHLALGGLAIFLISYCWIPIAYHRGLAVSYMQWLLMNPARIGDNPFEQLKRFQKDDEYYRRISADGGFRNLKGGPTRLKMDWIVPFLFLALWVGLMIWKICRQFA